MKERFTTVIIFIALLVFSLYNFFADSNSNYVLEVETPTIIKVDINGNGIVDEDETFCLPEITTFTANLKKNSQSLANTMGLTTEQSVKIGYLADEFSRNNLLGKKIKIMETGDNTPECRSADFIVEDIKYSDMLKNSGFAIVNDKPILPDKYNELYQKAQKLNLVILNHHSNKFHTLDCKYGMAARDSVVVLQKEIPSDTKPCKFCHVDKHTKTKSNSALAKSIPPPPNMVTDGNFKLILTDFTAVLKPDRNCTHAVCKDFVSAINAAHNSIDIASYGFANIPAINNALDKALKRGVKIRIVYDTNSKGTNYYEETNNFLEKFENKRSDKTENNPKLTNMLMHNKFAIFDNKKVYTGSMNFSITGFSGFNHNNVLIINSADVANIYEKEFEQMYNGKFHTLKLKSTNNINIKSQDTTISVYFSPQDKGMSTDLASLIRNSQKFIYIPSFLFTHKTLKNELINAHNRGIDVKIIIDANNTYGTHSVFKELRNAGIPVKVENYAGKMHAKTMIIDGNYLVLGSANFSNSGENKNDENMIIIKNTKLAGIYKDYFEYFWQKIPDKYLKQTVRPESKYSIGSCYDGIDNNFDGKIDNADSGCK